MKTLVKRACTPEQAPANLVSRVTLRVSSLRIERQS
jgi:hypothetical protein